MKLATAAAAVLLSSLPIAASAADVANLTPATPPEMVATYDALADVILGSRRAEERLVRSILATAYGHAQAALGHSRAALKAGDAAGARAAVENLAASVGQIGTEGDNAVAGVRKRLLEGGHHYNASGEAQGVYDEGYVVVTRAAKQAFLDSSKAIAMLARDPKTEPLEAEWKKVQAAWVKYIPVAR